MKNQSKLVKTQIAMKAISFNKNILKSAGLTIQGTASELYNSIFFVE